MIKLNPYAKEARKQALALQVTLSPPPPELPTTLPGNKRAAFRPFPFLLSSALAVMIHQTYQSPISEWRKPAADDSFSLV